MKNIIITLIFLLVASPLFAQMQTMVDTRKSYEGITVIEVEAGILDVDYRGSDSQTLEVEAFLESDSDQGQDIIFVTVGDALKIQYKSPSGRNNQHRTKGHLKLTGPREIQVRVKTTASKVSLQDINSDETQVNFVSGNITLSDIGGSVSLRGTSGTIKAENIGGSLTTKVTSGNAKISGVGENLDFVATSGRLEASNVDGLASVKLTSGNIKLDNIGEVGALSVTSGSIRANNANLGHNTQLNGSSGSIRVQTNSDLQAFNYDFSAGSGRVKVGSSSSSKSLAINNSAQHTIRGRISSGSIVIEN